MYLIGWICCNSEYCKFLPINHSDTSSHMTLLYFPQKRAPYFLYVSMLPVCNPPMKLWNISHRPVRYIWMIPFVFAFLFVFFCLRYCNDESAALESEHWNMKSLSVLPSRTFTSAGSHISFNASETVRAVCYHADFWEIFRYTCVILLFIKQNKMATF